MCHRIPKPHVHVNHPQDSGTLGGRGGYPEEPGSLGCERGTPGGAMYEGAGVGSYEDAGST